MACVPFMATVLRSSASAPTPPAVRSVPTGRGATDQLFAFTLP